MITVLFRGHRGPSLSPYWAVCWHEHYTHPPTLLLLLATSVLRGPGWGEVKCHVQNAKFILTSGAEKHLCDSGNLDISQSQMSMSASTAGQTIGLFKERIQRKRASVTSQAAVNILRAFTPTFFCCCCCYCCWCDPPPPVSLPPSVNNQQLSELVTRRLDLHKQVCVMMSLLGSNSADLLMDSCLQNTRRLKAGTGRANFINPILYKTPLFSVF